jgi:uncharacterized protein
LSLNWSDLGAAIALVLVFEGLLPFLSPTGWQEMMQKLSVSEPGSLRMIGLGMIVMGLLMLYLVRG